MVVQVFTFDHPELDNIPALDVARDYIRGLEAIVKEAESKFSKTGGPGTRDRPMVI